MDREIATKTLAELYLKQGNPQKALEVYRRILKREPENAEIHEAIRNLNRTMAQETGSHNLSPSQEQATIEKIKYLERWRDNIRRIRERRKNRDED